MARGSRVLVLSIILSFVSAPAVLAQVDNWAELHAVGGEFSVALTVELDIGGSLPAEWVGWVVDRSTIGLCESSVAVNAVTPFPVGEQVYQLTDHTLAEGITYSYRIFAVDALGGRHYLGGPPDFPPAYYHDDFASLGGNGAVARGVLTDLGWTVGMDVCPGFCWLPISFISSAPPELAVGAGTGVVVIIHGTIDNEFEGPYISTITDWAIVGGCGTVGDEETSWGDLKASFR